MAEFGIGLAYRTMDGNEKGRGAYHRLCVEADVQRMPLDAGGMFPKGIAVGIGTPESLPQAARRYCTQP